MVLCIYYLQITNGDGQAKDGFWVDAGIHAREWIAPATATYFIDRVSIPCICTPN